MIDSHNLLAEFIESGSDAAFRELVASYVDLVYSTALRLVAGDTHAAEDVAQTVFVDLSRLARKLPADVKLGGWLHRHTCYVAATHLRGERRRQSRERQAVEMNALQGNADTDFSLLAPILDEAINELGEADRTAILLRFFEQHDFRSVAQALGSNEDAARMRVNRALEKLESLLKRRGVAASSTGLAAALSANAVQAAPVGLAMTISTAATLGGTTMATAASAIKTIAMTTLQKTIITAALAVLAGAGIYEARQAAKLREQNEALQRQQAPLTEEMVKWSRAFSGATSQIAALRAENEHLNRNTAELLKLRSEVQRLRDESRQLAQRIASQSNDPNQVVAQARLDRVKLLKQRFEQWPGKRTPELQLLSEQDWLMEAAKNELESDAACREAMGNLRITAKIKFATAVKDALEQFIKSNNDQYPSDPSQLVPYLQPPADSVLANYEIAKPGSVEPPHADSEKAETWALVEKGNFTPEGKPIQDGSNLSDPDYDMYVVIYRGGAYMYSMGRPAK